jgi:hypothetical protein
MSRSPRRKASQKSADLINIATKVMVKVKLSLEQATKAQRWSTGIALLFL